MCNMTWGKRRSFREQVLLYLRMIQLKHSFPVVRTVMPGTEGIALSRIEAHETYFQLEGIYVDHWGRTHVPHPRVYLLIYADGHCRRVRGGTVAPKVEPIRWWNIKEKKWILRELEDFLLEGRAHQ